MCKQTWIIFPGQMVNLLSNDVGRFDGAVDWIHYLWIGPIQMIIVMFILWKIVGPECSAGTVLCVALIPFQGKLRLHEAYLIIDLSIKT